MLDIGKTLMQKFWYYMLNQNIIILCYMDTDSFIIHIKTADFYILQILLMIFKNGLTHQTTVKMIKVRFQ